MTKQIRNFVGLLLLFTAVSSFAQIKHTIQAKVPFSFMAAGKSWPAGDYIMQLDMNTGALTLRSSNITLVTVMSTNVGSPEEAARSYLRFQRCGEYRILREISLDGRVRILDLRKSERELLRAGLTKSRKQQEVVRDSEGAN